MKDDLLSEALEELNKHEEFLNLRNIAGESWGRETQYVWTAGDSYHLKGVVYISEMWYKLLMRQLI